MIEKSKVNIFIGMFGSGKTEISINTALTLNEKTDVAIADIDIISPYFRTRDEKKFLQDKGIKVITPPERYMFADIPIIAPEVGGFITNPKYKTILDVGGNEDGAIVLGSLHNFLRQVDVSTFFVINTKRPFTDEKDKIIAHIKSLSDKARLKVDYIVANPNVMDETTQEIILEGEKILESVSKEINIPIAFTAVDEKFQNLNTKYEKFIIKRFMKKIWE